MGSRQLNTLNLDNDAFRNSADEVNRYAEHSWSYDFFHSRLSLLWLRFDTFGKLLQEPNIRWNHRANRMSGPREDWQRIMRECSFAKAYYYIGEPHWDELRDIFCGREVVSFRVTIDDIGETSSDGYTGSDVLCLGTKPADGSEVNAECRSHDDC
ncbi:UNVERIFIED_CONTAM: hypothetical protein Sindi_2679200 [Sesamum indicum]